MTEEVDYQSVPVPTELVPDVYAFIAGRTGVGGAPANRPADTTAPLPDPGTTSAAEPSVTVRRNGIWQEADIGALEEKLRNRAGRSMMTMIANNSLGGEPTSYEDLRVAGAEAFAPDDFTYDQVRAQLSWISRYSKGIKGKNVWPLELEDLSNTDAPKGERYLYRMPPEIASWWLEAAGEETQ